MRANQIVLTGVIIVAACSVENRGQEGLVSQTSDSPERHYDIAADQKFVVYKEDKLVYVFNLEEGWGIPESERVFEMSEQELLSIEDEYVTGSDLIGVLSLGKCGDGIKCLTDGHNVIPPANDLDISWGFDGLQCKRLSPKAGTPLATGNGFECKAPNGATTQFNYSRSVGVMSFHTKCDGCFLGRFSLKSKAGLFKK